MKVRSPPVIPEERIRLLRQDGHEIRSNDDAVRVLQTWTNLLSIGERTQRDTVYRAVNGTNIKLRAVERKAAV